ncbi:DNA (cytosine-5-)-methyltransferase [Streptomyces sp. NPDC049577]|uniref:DNA cytosine methyltransferase n=1 Tax=Streptomyces sp. NPDC049577 TaxID=3155153 RepID=UPI003424CA31
MAFMSNGLTSLEICAGAGGQALGVERAGFGHVGLVEYNKHACATLRMNRPDWSVFETDVRQFDPAFIAGRVVDLLAGGVPCTPYSIAGKQLGETDERDLFPEALRLIEALSPRAVMLENAPTLLRGNRFAAERARVASDLARLGYKVYMQILDAQQFGVPQRRERALIVALREDVQQVFRWPLQMDLPPTVGEALASSMAARGWAGAAKWAANANDVAPTIVGGSEKHGGGDLGPRRAKVAWARLGVNGNSYADDVPAHDFVLSEGQGDNGWEGFPRLTTEQAALLQGFPTDWRFAGGKTARSKQVGNAFPPPVACAVAESIAEALQDPARKAA